MDAFRAMGRLLIFAGVALAAVGALLYFGAKLPFRIGQLPGDIAYRGKNTTIYFPIVTCLLISLLLTLVMWLFNRK
jgi:hypothetical protein